jgi:hypothetical protein
MFACNEQPTASDRSPRTSAANFFDRAPATGFGALEWLEPVAQDIEIRQKIGPSGGVIRLRRAGVEIRFPAGAVSETVLIEARALPGSVVAFEFGAHGLTFQAPVEIRIAGDRLVGSWWDGVAEEIFDGAKTQRHSLGLLGVYFVGDPMAGVTPVETLPIYLDDGDVVLEITHFSGYAVASG